MGRSRKRRRTWRERGCYAWRTRKPHAPLGLPVIGRHTAYVGQTSSRWHRDRQHLSGDARYGSLPAPWSDLAPKRYPLPCLFPQWRWSRELSEWAWTWILCPVYPVKKQPPWNLRRIGRDRAARQRAARDRRAGRLGWKKHAVDILVTLARIMVGAIVISALAVILMGVNR